FGQLGERLDALLIVADQTLDFDAGNVVARPVDPVGRREQRDRGGNSGQHENGGRHAPKGQLPPYAAAVDDGIGIERHGRGPSVIRAACNAGHSWHGDVEKENPRAHRPGVRFLGPGSAVRHVVLHRCRGRPHSSSFSAPARCLSAAPRMSPSEAPESAEPYCASASFSSATSSALIETPTLWVLRSNWVTRASTFWPTAKRSGRCSPRSRARSARLMKAERSVPTMFTSMPASFTSVTSQVTTEPFFISPAAPLAIGSPCSCLTPSEMRSFSTSTSSTWARTTSPFLYSSITCSPGRFQSRSERWTMPSTSPSRPRNRP